MHLFDVRASYCAWIAFVKKDKANRQKVSEGAQTL